MRQCESDRGDAETTVNAQIRKHLNNMDSLTSEFDEINDRIKLYEKILLKALNDLFEKLRQSLEKIFCDGKDSIRNSYETCNKYFDQLHTISHHTTKLSHNPIVKLINFIDLVKLLSKLTSADSIQKYSLILKFNEGIKVGEIKGLRLTIMKVLYHLVT